MSLVFIAAVWAVTAQAEPAAVPPDTHPQPPAVEAPSGSEAPSGAPSDPPPEAPSDAASGAPPIAPAEAGAAEPVPQGPPAQADAPAPARLMGALPEPDPDKQRLIAGAPLYNPNVAVHIVQQKQFTERGRHELALYPATAQLNGKFTQHFGSSLAYTYHLHENLGIQLTPHYNWSARESAFNLELVDKVRQQGQPATTLLLNWAATAGVEVTPLYGKFALYDGAMAQFSLVLSGGAGLGQTSHLLKPRTFGPEGQRFGESYGDTGQRFVGQVGGGLRVQLGDRFTLRFEVRDLVYTARVDQVNGCNVADLNAMFDRYASAAEGASLDGVAVRPGCNLAAFQGFDSTTGEERIHDVPRARQLVTEPSSDVLNNISFQAGFSVLF